MVPNFKLTGINWKNKENMWFFNIKHIFLCLHDLFFSIFSVCPWLHGCWYYPVLTDCSIYVKTGKDTVQIRYGQYAIASYADGEQVFEYNTKTGKLYYVDQTGEEVKKIEVK